MKRKSMFDVLPEDMPALSAAPSAGGAAVVLADDLARIVASFGLPQDGKEIGSVESVYPPKFKLRLEKAMEKNIDYIQKLDSGEFQRNKGDSNNKVPAMKPYMYAGNSLARPGIGVTTAPEAVHIALDKKCSVYVCGLPLDITESEIDILFSKIGSLRKIKIYKDKAGCPKGDALVTYTKPESAASACLKLNSLDIGDGFVLHVSPANYDARPTALSDSQCLQSGLVHAGLLSTVSAGRHNALPEECEAHLYPVVLIYNVYTLRDIQNKSADDFYSDLEADMLMECCQMGNVKRIIAGHASLAEGVVAVTFESDAGATKCAGKMSGRWFDGRQLETKLLLPNQNAAEAPTNNNFVSEAATTSGVQFSDSHSALSIHDAEEVNGSLTAEIIREVEDVEDFLNSLL